MAVNLLVMTRARVQANSKWSTMNNLFNRWRRYASSDAKTNYAKMLVKLFMFQVHPDYFHQYDSQKKINDTNLRFLMSFTNLNSDQTIDASMESTRTLTFYLKPSEDNQQPRRVRLGLHRVIESLTEILETAGALVPPPPEEVSNRVRRSNFFVSTCSVDVQQFFESIGDKKELIAWRADRKSTLNKLEDELKEKLQIDNIEYRHSWSAQNNSQMLRLLIKLVEDNTDTIRRPMCGMTIVFTADDCSFETPVDYREGSIRLNPTQVPAQWLSLLQSISPEQAKVTQVFVDQMHHLERSFERELLTALAKENGDVSQRLKFSIRRGFTCSKMNYFQFLRNCFPTKSTSEDREFPMLNSVDEVVDEREKDNSPDVDSESKAAVVRPIVCNIVVEDSHGTRILDDGNFRVDYTANDSKVLQLIGSSSIEEVISLKSKQYQQDDDTDLLL